MASPAPASPRSPRADAVAPVEGAAQLAAAPPPPPAGPEAAAPTPPPSPPSSPSSGGYRALGDQSLPALFEAHACLVAQAGFRVQAAAYRNVSESLRHDERLLRGIAGMRYGVHARTTLMWEAHCGDAARVAELIAHGSDVRAVDAFGRSALDYAVAGGHDACAAVLREAGAVACVAFGGAPVGTWGPVGGWADCVYSLAVCRGGRIAVSHLSGAIVLRDTATGAVTATLQRHTSGVMALVLIGVTRRALR